MVKVIFDDKFERTISKIKDNSVRDSINKKVKKIIENPEVGKSMRNVRKGTREIYLKPFRLSYSYKVNENFVYILDLYHKKK